ncbi:MAG: DUF4197 domain-containing protein [Burkholderiales bacterium]|nr:DUF4197 domain-containing protein [Burkholderiales bacterium]MDE2398330.1 DUF4197 domain-containing protein [Burkholderiales bacterium]MDE2452015.1 DUF4197 domain-containing protein [Burkholderiales bacterium]
MKRREFTAGVLAASGLGLAHVGAGAADLSQRDAAAGIRAALEKGANSAVELLGRPDGFLGNPKVRIPLPGFLDGAAQLLRTIGQGHKVDDLVTAMNRAAEAAVPEAKTLLIGAARSITATDALKIVRGGETSVTDYFASRTRAPLGVKFLPIVTRATEKVSLAERYNAVAGKAVGLGLVKKDDANIQQYVTRKTLDGLYTMIGDEEKKIRADPVGAGSAILAKVFGH